MLLQKRVMRTKFGIYVVIVSYKPIHIHLICSVYSSFKIVLFWLGIP
jgi:hypothetical protein